MEPNRAAAGSTDSSAIGVPKAQEACGQGETLLRLRRPDRRAIGVTLFGTLVGYSLIKSRTVIPAGIIGRTCS